MDGPYRITYKVVSDEAHFEIGTRTVTVNLIASDEGLDKLVTTASQALRAMRAADGQGHPSQPEA